MRFFIALMVLATFIQRRRPKVAERFEDKRV
jgi:hypothetical protein